jgi:hypothetical protein
VLNEFLIGQELCKKPVRIISRLRPYEKFVQRLRGSGEEAGKDQVFSVSTSLWLLLLQRSGW